MKKRSFLKQSLWGLLGFSAVCFFFLICILVYFELQLPNVGELKDVHLQVPLRIFASTGDLIAEYGTKRRSPVTLKQIPSSIIDATLATEDQRYYSHPGVDVLGLARAAVVLILTGKKQQGGSTITMQVARNYFLTRKKTYSRKIREILLALKIDHTLSKDKVLELYFNKIYYGNRAYGIAAAAHVYYGKKLDNLTLPQAAMLAGLPKAPSVLNPLANPVDAKDRRDHVLTRMHDQGYITDEEYKKTMNAPLTAKYHGSKVLVKAPYVAEMIREEMIAEYGKKAYTKGLNVYTTIVPALQKDANIALREGVLSYDKRHGYRGAQENLGHTPPADLTVWQKDIKNIPTINTLQPAVVLTMNNEAKSITALLKNGNIVTINWPAMRWARSQFFKGNDEFLGARPKQPSDIVKVGDVIRTNEVNGQWKFSQVPQVSAALVAMNPEKGSILALVGGFDYTDSQFNRAVQAYRQPGSSFKPFVYSAALAKGYTLASMINDAPVVQQANNESGLWRPENDTRKFYGPTSVREGLIKSRNLVSIRLLQLIGIPYAIEYATRFGFHQNQLPNGLSLALGTADVTPLQTVTAYSVFANGGYQVAPHLINHITDTYGKTIFYTATPVVCDKKCQQALQEQQLVQTINEDENKTPGNPIPKAFQVATRRACSRAAECTVQSLSSETSAQQSRGLKGEGYMQRPFAQRVITPQNAYLMTQALKGVILYGTGRPALALHRNDLAGKTGTTNDQVDAWFSGYNHNLVATAWMGFDTPRPLYEYATRSALPIWMDFMRPALKGKPSDNVPQPSDIISVRIDPKTGQLATPGQPGAIFEVFRKEYAPTHITNTSTAGIEGNSSDNLEQALY